MADVVKGEGPDQLPQGAATEINEATPSEADLRAAAGGGAGPVPPDMEPEFDEPDDGESPSTGDKDEDDFLFEDPPPELIDDARGPGYGPVPQDVIDRLEDLAAASRDPSAPPQLTLLVQLLADRLGA